MPFSRFPFVALLGILLSFSAATRGYSQTLEQDSLALVALYNATDGPNWNNNTGWLTAPVSDWYGITISEERVTWVVLRHNNLTGYLPPEIGMLTKLINLSLTNNNLSGDLPEELGNLTSLLSLWIEINQFTGALPESIVNLPFISQIVIDDNQITDLPDLGPYADNPGFLYLQASENRLTFEDIEPNIGYPINFHYGHQRRFGSPREETIPEGGSYTLEIPVGGQHNQYQWYKEGYPIEGATGSTYSITNAMWHHAGIYHLEVTNSLVPDLTLESEQVVLSVGDFTPGLEADSLALVALYHATNGPSWTNNTNWLTGPLTTWHGVQIHGIVGADEKRIAELILFNNNLSGTLPAEMGHLTYMFELWLSGNKIGGSVPSTMRNLVNLRELILAGNSLSGNLSWVQGFTKLRELQLGGNNFSGDLPAWLGTFHNLKQLGLSGNAFTGGIPAELGNLSQLESLSLDGNKLIFGIPESLGNLTRLYTLDLSGNLLTGTIPASLGNLTELGSLMLYDNLLLGDVPESLANLNKLRTVWLFDNELTSLPDLSDAPLDNVFLRNNRFNFDDLEPYAGVRVFIYNPQFTAFRESEEITVQAGEALTLHENLGGDHTTFRWSKRASGTDFEDGPILHIESVSVDDAGYYYVDGTNSLLNMTRARGASSG